MCSITAATPAPVTVPALAALIEHAHEVNTAVTAAPNMALLCVAHHHAVHEGGWTMRLRPGFTGHEQGCWAFEPPPFRRRPLQP